MLRLLEEEELELDDDVDEVDVSGGGGGGRIPPLTAAPLPERTLLESTAAVAAAGAVRPGGCVVDDTAFVATLPLGTGADGRGIGWPGVVPREETGVDVSGVVVPDVEEDDADDELGEAPLPRGGGAAS